MSASRQGEAKADAPKRVSPVPRVRLNFPPKGFSPWGPQLLSVGLFRKYGVALWSSPRWSLSKGPASAGPQVSEGAQGRPFEVETWKWKMRTQEPSGGVFEPGIQKRARARLISLGESPYLGPSRVSMALSSRALPLLDPQRALECRRVPCARGTQTPGPGRQSFGRRPIPYGPLGC